MDDWYWYLRQPHDKNIKTAFTLIKLYSTYASTKINCMVLFTAQQQQEANDISTAPCSAATEWYVCVHRHSTSETESASVWSDHSYHSNECRYSAANRSMVILSECVLRSAYTLHRAHMSTMCRLQVVALTLGISSTTKTPTSDDDMFMWRILGRQFTALCYCLSLEDPRMMMDDGAEERPSKERAEVSWKWEHTIQQLRHLLEYPSPDMFTVLWRIWCRRRQRKGCG